MSYFADHLAWQQRVNQEFKVNCHHQDEDEDPMAKTRYSQYPDMINYMMVKQKSHNKQQRETVREKDWLSYEEMRRHGREVAEQGPFNSSFYQSQRGVFGGTSMGMQGVLNSGNYAYVPRSGRLNSSKRMQSAGAGTRREFKQRSNSRLGQKNNLDAVSYVSATSEASGQRLRSVGHRNSKNIIIQSSQRNIPGKQERFNEEVETKSTVSKQKAYNMLSSKNLARFTKGRPSLKVVGTPNLNATKSQASGQFSEHRSVFSAQSRFSNRKQEQHYDGASSQGGMRVHKSFAAAEAHKKRILDVVNQLTAEELEKVSEMLRASEAAESTHQGEDDQALTVDATEVDGEVRLDEDGALLTEAADQVGDLVSRGTRAQDGDNLTSVSRAQSSSRSMVASLSKQLQDERDARRKLENELRGLQSVSKGIHQKMKSKGMH